MTTEDDEEHFVSPFFDDDGVPTRTSLDQADLEDLVARHYRPFEAEAGKKNLYECARLTFSLRASLTRAARSLRQGWPC